MLTEETGITKVVDPLGGSYYVEALTAQLVDDAWKLIEEVDAIGGMTKAVATGMPKQRIEQAAAAKQARIDRGEDVIVGIVDGGFQPENSSFYDQVDGNGRPVKCCSVGCERFVRNAERREANRQSREEGGDHASA